MKNSLPLRNSNPTTCTAPALYRLSCPAHSRIDVCLFAPDRTLPPGSRSLNVDKKRPMCLLIVRLSELGSLCRTASAKQINKQFYSTILFKQLLFCNIRYLKEMWAPLVSPAFAHSWFHNAGIEDKKCSIRGCVLFVLYISIVGDVKSQVVQGRTRNRMVAGSNPSPDCKFYRVLAKTALTLT